MLTPKTTSTGPQPGRAVSQPAQPQYLAAVRIAALTTGAFAAGALAVGALAIGALAIGRLAIGRSRIRRLEIDELVVRRLDAGDVRVSGNLEVPSNAHLHTARGVPM